MRWCETVKATVRPLAIVLGVTGSPWRVLSIVLSYYYFLTILAIMWGIDGVWLGRGW